MGSSTDKTYVKIYRSLVNWEWYHDIPTTKLFLHFILIANWNEGHFRGTTIRRGELVRSLAKLSAETALTIAQCRTAISHLLSTNDITIRRVGKTRIICISKFEELQGNTIDSTNIAQTSHKPRTYDSTDQRKKRNKEIKKEKSADAPVPSERGPTPPPGWGEGGWKD